MIEDLISYNKQFANYILLSKQFYILSRITHNFYKHLDMNFNYNNYLIF